MTKTLRVIDPFFMLELGDTLTYSDDEKMYVAERNEEFHKAGESNDLSSSYSSTFKASPEYAKELITGGYVEEVPEEKKQKQSFVNVFDEIDSLIGKYNDELENIDEDMATMPQCLKVEKTTVLSNILGVLGHLKKLRK